MGRECASQQPGVQPAATTISCWVMNCRVGKVPTLHCPLHHCPNMPLLWVIKVICAWVDVLKGVPQRKATALFSLTPLCCPELS